MGYPANDVRLKFTAGPWSVGVLGKEDGTPELCREEMSRRFRDSIMRGPEGNRCYFVTAMIDGEDVTIGYTGNGPTSEANAQLISYVPELVMRIDELETSCAALRARCEAAEAQLCRARDYLLTIKSSVENVAGAFIGYVDVDAMINGLNESSPCRHAAIASRVGDTEGELAELRRRAKEGKNA